MNFDASTSQGASHYVWNFGDGSTDSTSGANPSHPYSKIGNYVVTLTVVDGAGNTDSTSQSISVTDQQPNATFTAPAEMPTGTTVQFDGTGSNDPDGSIASYSWNFGDGGSSAAAQPTHTYQHAGTYPVTLTVTDDAGQANSVTHSAVVDDRPPSASFTPSSASSTVGTPVSFDGSGSLDPDGSVVAYDWVWGDGSADGHSSSATHTYSAVGSYPVTLTVTDNSGQTNTSSPQTITVTGAPPTASFQPPAEAPTGTTLHFDGSGSTPTPTSTITSYDWSWGDGTPDGSGATPTHSYTKARAYQVTLTVSDSAGQTSSPTSHTITVDDRPPAAAAAFDPVSATILTSTPLAFDGALSSDPDGTIASYSWDFGDGSSSTDAQPSHSYANAGTYTVKLTVTDNSGNTAVGSHQITVNAPPGLVIATVVNPPAVISSGSPSTTASGAVDLGQRLFCAGIGPSCQAYITATSSALARDVRAARRGSARHGKPTTPPKPTTSPAGIATLTTAQNGSVELTFKLSKAALASLRKYGRLPLKVTILAARGTQRTSSTLSLTLKLPAKRKG